MKKNASFIIECPGCQTRYEIPVAIPDSGRKVRCAKCSHVWTVQPGDEIDLSDFLKFDEMDEDVEVIFAGGEAEPGPQTEPESGLETDSESGPRNEAEPESAPVPETDHEPAAEAMPSESAEPVFAPEPTGEDPADEPDSVAEFYGDESETPESEPEPENEPRSVPEPEAEPEAETVAEPEAETVAEPEAEIVAAPEVETAAEPEAETAAEPEAETAAEPEVETAAEPEVETVAETEAETVAEAVPEQGSESEHDFLAGQDIDFFGDGEEKQDKEPEKIVVGRARRRHRVPARALGAAAGWGMLCVALFGVGYIATSQRLAVVRALPGTAWVYEKLGFAVNVRGLDFRGVDYTWETDAGRVVLQLHGDIVNITGRKLDVPSVVFALRDENETEVYQWEDKVLNEPLAAGERATFAIQIPTPPKSIKSVQVRFAKAR